MWPVIPAVATYSPRQFLRRSARIVRALSADLPTAGLPVAAAVNPLDIASQRGQRIV